MTELKLNLMKKFKELNVAEYTTKYGDYYGLMFAGADIATKELQGELDCQKNRNKFCYSCANAEDRCFRNEIGCPCQKYKSYKEENAELKARNKWYSEQVCNKECAEVWGNLTKAKELLNEFMRISKASDEDFEHDYSELIGETEQFLSEMEKC